MRYLFFLLVISLSCSQISAQYCTPTANCTLGDGIRLFAVGGFSNASECEADLGIAGYADFTELTGLELQAGTTHSLSLQSNYPNQQISIWIDSDESSSFESTELVLTDAAVGEDVVTFTLNIPASIPLGQYRLRVKANFSGPSSVDPCESTFYGECEDYTITITEPPSCLNVIDIAAVIIEANSATLTWTEQGSAEAWDIEFGQSGFTPTGTPTLGYDDITVPAQVTGLDPVTTYDVYVRADCGQDNVTDVSAWAGPFTIVTACAAVTPAYFEDFDDGLGDCWEVFGSGDLQTGPVDVGFSGWNNTGFANYEGLFGGSQGVSVFGTGNNMWIISPSIDLTSATSYQLEVDAAMTQNFTQQPAMLDSDDRLALVATSDGGATWNMVAEWTSENTLDVGGEHIIVDLSEYSGTVSRFGFLVATGTEGNGNFHSFIDNFRIQESGSPLAAQVDIILEAQCSQFGNNVSDVLVSITGGMPPYTYLWSDGSDTEDLIDAELGTYSIVVTDANGDTTSIDNIDVPGIPVLTINAVVVNESVDGASDGSITITSVEGGTPGYSYLWNTGTSGDTLVGLFDAIWCVTVTDLQFCQTDTCFEVLAGPPPSSTFELAAEIGLSIYPNPSMDGPTYMDADLSSDGPWTLMIWDNSGRIVTSRKLDNDSYERLSIADGLETGLYRLQLTDTSTGRSSSRPFIR